MDLRCLYDLDLFGAECETPLEEYEQDVIHRVIQRKGTNLDDLNSGEAIGDFLSSQIDPEITAVRLEAEIRNDERTASVSVTIVQTTNGNEGTTVDVQIEAETTDGLLLQTTTTGTA